MFNGTFSKKFQKLHLDLFPNCLVLAASQAAPWWALHSTDSFHYLFTVVKIMTGGNYGILSSPFWISWHWKLKRCIRLAVWSYWHLRYLAHFQKWNLIPDGQAYNRLDNSSPWPCSLYLRIIFTVPASTSRTRREDSSLHFFNQHLSLTMITVWTSPFIDCSKEARGAFENPRTFIPTENPLIAWKFPNWGDTVTYIKGGDLLRGKGFEWRHCDRECEGCFENHCWRHWSKWIAWCSRDRRNDASVSLCEPEELHPDLVCTERDLRMSLTLGDSLAVMWLHWCHKRQVTRSSVAPSQQKKFLPVEILNRSSAYCKQLSTIFVVV